MERVITAVLLCIGGAVYAQVPGLGPCFDAKPQSTLNVSQYLGHWYEITKLPSFFEIEQVCLTANYSVKEDGHIKVFNAGKVNGKNVSSTGDAYVPNPSEPSKLIVQFPQEILRNWAPLSKKCKSIKIHSSPKLADPFHRLLMDIWIDIAGVPAPYWILETDYTSYSMILSCSNLTALAHVQFAWVLSRTPTLDKTVLDGILQKFQNNGVPSSDFHPTLQNNCTDNKLYFEQGSR